MEWEFVSHNLEVEPLIKEKPLQNEDSSKEYSSDNESEKIKDISTNNTFEDDKEYDSPHPVKRIVPSQKKIFQPTPSPPPIEIEDVEEISPCPKNSTFVKFIYLGFVIYLFSEYSKQFVEKNL